MLNSGKMKGGDIQLKKCIEELEKKKENYNKVDLSFFNVEKLKIWRASELQSN
jgi:hypothetical protein